jgi:hypothetical protein
MEADKVCIISKNAFGSHVYSIGVQLCVNVSLRAQNLTETWVRCK